MRTPRPATSGVSPLVRPAALGASPAPQPLTREAAPGDLDRNHRTSEALAQRIEQAILAFRTPDNQPPTLGELKVALSHIVVRATSNEKSLDKWLSDLSLASRAIFVQVGATK